MLEDDIFLRPWKSDDAADVLAAFKGAGMWSQGAADLQSHNDAEAWLREHTWDPSARRTSLALEVDGHAVGDVSLAGISRAHGTAWVSYWVHQDYRGRQFATRAAATLAHWAFTEGMLHRLELGHRQNNPESGRVARAAGFILEGTQREKLCYGDERFDVDIYARLATDPHPACEFVPVLAPPAAAP
jgi:ribosomal-protein-alanine N-acetyltransferase